VHRFGQFAIAIWYGSTSNIPTGWVLCDGTNGTPDLTDRFVMGAGTTAPDVTGGSIQHTHTYTGDGHDHFVDTYPDGPGAGAVFSDSMSLRAESGTTELGGDRPAFKSLCYIMEV